MVIDTYALKRLLLFGALLGWCAVLVLLRVLRSGSLAYGFLVWNLFLAAVPAFAARLFWRAAERRSSAWIQVAGFAAWLAFLPNAPYIITDFMHLRARPPVPLWYDVALLGSCAGTGLLLGYSSLADVQDVLARKRSRLTGWLVALAALGLSGFGIYLGRFLRWNSWDAITEPGRLFADIASRVRDPLSYPRTWGFTLVYGAALSLGYLALRVFHSPRPSAREACPIAALEGPSALPRENRDNAGHSGCLTPPPGDP